MVVGLVGVVVEVVREWVREAVIATLTHELVSSRDVQVHS